jgi:4a-hydroxytetrahydrobiopterin dehydratase
MRPKKLLDDEVQERFGTITGWQLVDGSITKTFVFRDFLHSIAFINRLAVTAEELQHHPDLDIRYNKVTTTLSTHDAGGLTELDFKLAAVADAFAKEVSQN